MHLPNLKKIFKRTGYYEIHENICFKIFKHYQLFICGLLKKDIMHELLGYIQYTQIRMNRLLNIKSEYTGRYFICVNFDNSHTYARYLPYHQKIKILSQDLLFDLFK
jgi:hypothetical protein